MENFTVKHMAVNGVAPADTICEYGTISIPSTPNILWLDRNLGATKKPVKLSDTSKEAAGWYFQFNRKQGMMYTTQRIPGDTWEKFIMESYDWQDENNPCFELGEGWRLPTKQECEAVETWGTSTGAWNSPLKMHAAGYLYNGVLKNRGNNGGYWASKQSISEYGWCIYFHPGVSSVRTFVKTMGFTIRPVKDVM